MLRCVTKHQTETLTSTGLWGMTRAYLLRACWRLHIPWLPEETKRKGQRGRHREKKTLHQTPPPLGWFDDFRCSFSKLVGYFLLDPFQCFDLVHPWSTPFTLILSPFLDQRKNCTQELCPTALPPDFRMYYGLRGDDGMGDGWGWVGIFMIFSGWSWRLGLYRTYSAATASRCTYQAHVVPVSQDSQDFQNHSVFWQFFASKPEKRSPTKTTKARAAWRGQPGRLGWRCVCPPGDAGEMGNILHVFFSWKLGVL